MQKPTRKREPCGPRSTSRARAILLMMLAVTLFACLDATAKYLVTIGQIPATQVVWVRFAGQLLIMIVALGALNVPSLLATRKWKHQALRSTLLLFSTVFNFLALRHLRLDQTVTIQFLAPLIVALLAGPLLGEWVGWRRLVAIGVGFLGVLIVIRPGFAGFHPAMLLALGCVLSYAGFILLTRYLSAHDRAEVTLFCSLIVGTYLMAPVALVDWVWPTAAWQWALLASMGLWAGVGHYVFILAHRYAPASSVAPFMYFQLVSVTAIGFLLFADLPDRWTLAGSAVIVASGVYLWHRERVRAAERDE
jgi:drug/metabolite transporter (DMT)-like permease